MTLLLQRMALAALLAGIITVLVTPLVKSLAFRAGVVREPRNRDMHEKPTPLWGGIAMFVGFSISVLALRPLAGQEIAVAVGKGEHPILGILLGGTFVAVMGLLDDKFDLSPKVQALSLLIGGLIAALLGARIPGVTNPLAPLPAAGQPYTSENYIALPFWLSIALTMLWVFFAAKTFDFLDGLDGLAAGVCAIAATTMGLMAAMKGEVAVALMAAALVGACVGFLRHNYNPASIFMGTVGSFFLGFMLASLSIVGAYKLPAAIAVAVPLLVLGVPVFDALYVVGRRILRGDRPTGADKTHIHHRLLERGLNTRQAVWTVYALTAGMCLVALLLAWNWRDKG